MVVVVFFVGIGQALCQCAFFNSQRGADSLPLEARRADSRLGAPIEEEMPTLFMDCRYHTTDHQYCFCSTHIFPSSGKIRAAGG